MIGTFMCGYDRSCSLKTVSKDSPKMEGWNAASCAVRTSAHLQCAGDSALTDAVSISAVVGGFPLGPLREMYAKRRRQYFAMTSTRPSWCIVACWRYERKYASKSFEGGKVTSRTHSSCQPLKTLSLYSDHGSHQLLPPPAAELDAATHAFGFPVSCFITWQ